MANQICTQCGYVGEANKKARGNGLVEFILWWFFLVPGIIYSIWSRGGNGKSVCSKCGCTTIIPVDTPMGQKLLTDTGQKLDETIIVQGKKNNNTLVAIIVALLVFFTIVMISLMTAQNK